MCIGFELTCVDAYALTETLRAALATVEIRVLDHLVIGIEGRVSMAERGWL